MERTKQANKRINLVGKTVYSITSPGAMPTEAHASSVGVITDKESGMFGSFYIVDWTSGEKEGGSEPVTVHTVRPASNPAGIGVYYDDSEADAANNDGEVRGDNNRGSFTGAAFAVDLNE